MDRHLEELLERFRRFWASLSVEEQARLYEEHRRSFAYGNAKISNPTVTREEIDAAAERLAAKTVVCGPVGDENVVGGDYE